METLKFLWLFCVLGTKNPQKIILMTFSSEELAEPAVHI